MSRRKQNDRLLVLASRGAEVRLRELVSEMKTLVGLFPHLGDSFDPDELPVRFIIAKDGGQARRTAPGRAAPTRSTSAAARKKMRERMKKRWANRRTAK